MGRLSAAFAVTKVNETEASSINIQKQFTAEVSNYDSALDAIRNQRQNNRKSIIDSGRILSGLRVYLANSKADDGESQWNAALRNCGLSSGIANDMMLVANDRNINDPLNATILPNELTSLKAVASMDDEEFATCRSVGHLHAASTAASLKTFRKSYSEFGQEAILEAYRAHVGKIGGNKKAFSLPSSKSESKTLLGFGKIKFDSKLIDNQDAYDKALAAFTKAVEKIHGLSHEPAAVKTIEALYKKEDPNADKKKRDKALDQWKKGVDAMLTGGMSLDDAIGLIKRPGKDILDSLGDEHWIWLVNKTDKNGDEVLDADDNPVRKSGYLKPRTKSLQEIVRGQKEVRFTSEIDMDDGQLEHEQNLGYHGRTKGGQVIDDVEAMQTAEDNLKNR